MSRLFLSALILVMLTLSAEGAPPRKPKKVKCKDRKFPNCFHKELLCPANCPRNCFVNCASCKTACTPPPPPPPPPPPRPRRVSCHDRKFRGTCNADLFCPAACPKTCTVDCASCRPVCSLPMIYSPPPPVVVDTPSPPPVVVVKASPPPPTPVPDTSSSPPPVVVDTPSPPPVVVDTPSPPPVVVDTPSPPPVVDTPSSPPPAVVNASPPPPTTVPDISSPPPPVVDTPSPPLVVDTPSPPPVVDTPSPPPPTTVPNTASPPPPVVVVTPIPPPPDSSEVLGGKRVRCKIKSYPSCYYREHRCPAGCPGTCEVDCVTCSPVCDCNRPGAVCQDPRFVAADGLTFYFHGKMDRDFCVVSDRNLHINAHFIGKRNPNMGRDFTWVQSLGILFGDHRIFIGAKKTATWDNAVDRLELSYDGLSISLPEQEGAKWESNSSPKLIVTRSRDANAAVIEVEGNFRIKAAAVPITEEDSRIHGYGITEEDCFAHLDLGFKFYSLSDGVNGVLGQTYAGDYVSRVKMGVDMPVLGGQREFASSSLFSTDCAVARFEGTRTSSSSSDFEFGNLKCASGIDGRGVICKR